MIKSPEVYLSRPPMIFKRVVLPLPEGPRIDTNSEFLNLILNSFNAFCLKLPVSYILVIIFSSKILSHS